MRLLQITFLDARRLFLKAVEGQASVIEIHAREAIALMRRIEEIIAQHTGQPLEKVSKDMERDYFLTAEEAVGGCAHLRRTSSGASAETLRRHDQSVPASLWEHSSER